MRSWRGRDARFAHAILAVKRLFLRSATLGDPLYDQVLLGQAENAGYPELSADVLEKVTEMTGENWREKAEELQEMLRAVER